MSKTLVIVLAVVALGLFAIAGSVIYATQQLKPLECGEGYRLERGRSKDKCVSTKPLSKKESDQLAKKRLKEFESRSMTYEECLAYIARVDWMGIQC